jgi:hypothetical protein
MREMGGYFRIISLACIAVLFSIAGPGLAQYQDPSDQNDMGVWVLTEKWYNSSFKPLHPGPDTGLNDMMDHEELKIEESAVFYEFEQKWPTETGGYTLTYISGRSWTPPPLTLHPGEEIKTTLSCESVCWSDDSKNKCDSSQATMDFWVASSCDPWEYNRPVEPFFNGHCVVDSKGDNVPAQNSEECIWKVPGLDDTSTSIPGCYNVSEKLTIAVTFDYYQLSGLNYYYNYTYQPASGKENTTTNPEGQTDSIPQAVPPVCDRLKAYIDEAGSSNNACLLRTKVVEICSGEEHGLDSAKLEYRIWDSENADYRDLVRSSDSLGECLLEVPNGTWRVDVYASKEGYDEGWTNIYYCCGEGQNGSSVIYNNWNAGVVENGPTCSPFFTLSGPQMITYIDTYHWNNGQGASPGYISLINGENQTFGPWAASAESASGADNVWWKCLPNETIPAGTYTIVDSQPETWSFNSGSACGFAKVEGYPISQQL